eukprot:gene7375-15062_t
MKGLCGLIILPCIFFSYAFSLLCSPKLISRTPLIRSIRQYSTIGDIRDQLSLPQESLCIAVDQTPSKKLSVSDAAALSGCDLRTARKGMILLAALTGANLDVTKDGEIIYRFPDNFRQVLQKRSIAQKVKIVFDSVKQPIFYLFRISFGLMLLASLAIIGTTFIFISSSSSSSDSDERNRNRPRLSSSFGFNSWGPSPLDFILYGPRETAYGSNQNQNERSFLESFFSYIFGDGDPNKGKCSQLKACARVIRRNGGVAVAEQLAPYLDPPQVTNLYENLSGSGSSSSSSLVKEDWVLPAVVQLAGVPTVTEDGSIVYLFPEILTTARDNNDDDGDGDVDNSSVLEEEIVPFSRARDFDQAVAGGLGVMNLVGAVQLRNVLSSVQMLTRYPQLALVSKLMPFLMTYAILYNVIPLVRGIQLKKRNEDIEQRNVNRKRWSKFLKSGDQAISRKLLAANNVQNDLKMSMKRVIDEDMVYSTSEDFAAASGERALEDFDMRLKNKLTSIWTRIKMVGTPESVGGIPLTTDSKCYKFGIFKVTCMDVWSKALIKIEHILRTDKSLTHIAAQLFLKAYLYYRKFEADVEMS